MKITDLKITLFSRELPTLNYGPKNPTVGGKNVMGLVSIHTDEGLVGHGMVGSVSRAATADGQSLISALKPVVMGQDPLNRELLFNKLLQRHQHTTWRCIGAVDVALWDLVGKIANLPIYKVIGAYRDKVHAYASSPGMRNPEDYIREALEVRDTGYAAYKIHPPREGWKKDIVVSQKVREAVGDDYTLMLDSSWQYSYTEALTVGREIEKLGFYWYEDPLENDDLYNCAKLREKLDIPLMATQDVQGDFHAYVPWLIQRATDFLRGDVVKGGISSCLKTAHLAEAFRMRYEIHHGGNSINNVANLHLMCSIQNSEFYEVILPLAAQQCGLVNDLKVDKDGMLTAPQGPGLGIEVDTDYIKSNYVGELS